MISFLHTINLPGGSKLKISHGSLSYFQESLRLILVPDNISILIILEERHPDISKTLTKK